MQALYLSPLKYGSNPGVDAIAHGLDFHLRQAGIELFVQFTDFSQPNWLDVHNTTVDEAIARKVDALILYILDPAEPAQAVQRARGAGIPVFTFERPRFAVDSSLVYPNFNQGAYLAEELAAMLPPGAGVAVVGGPKIVDDEELLAGIVHGVQRSGLRLLNDPTLDEYRNESDLRPGGRETALRILADVPHMDGFIPFNDETMLGTLDALDEVGRAGEMKLVSRNGSPNAVAAVRAGKTHGTWDIDCPSIGRALGELVVSRLRDNSVHESTLAIGPIGRFIRLNNVETWRPWSERVPFTALNVLVEQ